MAWSGVGVHWSGVEWSEVKWSEVKGDSCVHPLLLRGCVGVCLKRNECCVLITSAERRSPLHHPFIMQIRYRRR